MVTLVEVVEQNSGWLEVVGVDEVGGVNFQMSSG